MPDDLKNAVQAEIEKLALEFSETRLALDVLIEKIDAARLRLTDEIDLLDRALGRVRHRFEAIGSLDADTEV